MQRSATLCFQQHNFPLTALVDLWADNCFLDKEFALRSIIPLEPLGNPFRANTLDGRLLAQVTHRSVPVNLVLSGNHSEMIRLNIITSADSPLVLGYTWLKLINSV